MLEMLLLLVGGPWCLVGGWSLRLRRAALRGRRQGLTLVHFSAQPERFLTSVTSYVPSHTP